MCFSSFSGLFCFGLESCKNVTDTLWFTWIAWGHSTVNKIKQARYLCSQRASLLCTSSTVCSYDLHRFGLMLQRLFAIFVVLWVLRWKKSGERLVSCFLFLWLTGLILLIGVLGLPIISFKVGMEITCFCLPADKEAELCCCLCCLETASPCEKYLCTDYQAANIQQNS